MRCFLLLWLVPGSLAESRISFDFGWKFSLGATHIAEQDLCPDSSWQHDLDGFYCEGWGHQAAYSLTEDECRLYCCGDPACAGYSFKGTGRTTWCVVGSDLSACFKDPSKGYRGKGRRTPAPIVLPTSGFETPDYNDSAWETIDVPHDFVVTVPPSRYAEQSHGYRFKNISFYRKHFGVDAGKEGMTIFLDFDGIFRSSDIWFNGVFLGHHSSGYTSASFRIDEKKYGLKYGGDNVIALRVDPRADEGWWYEGGGIYRHTWLRFAARTHGKNIYIAPVVTGPISKAPLTAAATAPMEVTVENHGTLPTSATAKFTITKEGGKQLWQMTTGAQVVPADGEVKFKATANLTSVDLWDLEAPTLYVLSAEIISGDPSTSDEIQTKFGFRKADFDADRGFFLNGRHVKVKGMCNHHDFAGIGTAVPDSLSAFRIKILKSFGVNAWRMSHNPPSPELLDKADELGILIWDENRFFGDHQTWYHDMRDMLIRDRNHPSIIWWSLCNEFGCTQLSDNVTLSTGKKFRAIVKDLDPSRPISGAWNGDMTLGQKWGEEVCDMMGINYNYGALATYHEAQPKTPLISSESCSCTSDRSYKVNDSEALLGTYHAWSCIRDCWNIIANSSYVQGSFDWTGFDYRGEETPSSWPAVNSHFGVLDLAGFMKDDAFYYKAWYDAETPLVHITPPNWNYVDGSTVQVWIYTNGDEVELFLNGKSLGKQSILMFEKGTYLVGFEEGELTAKVTRKGTLWASETIKTAGAPVAINVALDELMSSNNVVADGQDAMLVTATLVDSQGVTVRHVDPELTFTVDGPGRLIGLGNGNPSNHEDEKGQVRRVFNGKVRAVIQAGKMPGEITVTAASPGLKSGSVSFRTRNVQDADIAFV